MISFDFYLIFKRLSGCLKKEENLFFKTKEKLRRKKKNPVGFPTFFLKESDRKTTVLKIFRTANIKALSEFSSVPAYPITNTIKLINKKYLLQRERRKK